MAKPLDKKEKLFYYIDTIGGIVRGGRMNQHGEDHIDKVSGDIKEDLIKRLRRIEGQVRGLQRMIEEDRPCQEVVYQVAAVKAAVVQVAMTILSNQLASCLTQELAEGGHPEAAVKRFTEVFKKFY